MKDFVDLNFRRKKYMSVRLNSMNNLTIYTFTLINSHPIIKKLSNKKPFLKILLEKLKFTTKK